MTIYNNVLKELQYFILTEDNIQRSLEMKLKYVTKEKKRALNSCVENKNKYYIPNEFDTLFWCFYILQNGHVKYETLYSKNEIVSKQIKINYVEDIRKNKQLIKAYKFDTMSNIENNLVNEKKLNVKTFLTLCAIENMNVLFVKNNTN